MMKLSSAYIILTFCCFLVLLSCADDGRVVINDPDGTTFYLENRTDSRHVNFLCSDGQTLTFSIRANGSLQSFDLNERGGKSLKLDIEEGDQIIIQIFDTEGSLMLSREKIFSPSNPEVSFDDSIYEPPNPTIAVCDTGELEIVGF